MNIITSNLSDSDEDTRCYKRSRRDSSCSSSSSSSEDDLRTGNPGIPVESFSKTAASFMIEGQATNNQPTYSENANKMMKVMGYKKGSGLGKHNQGRSGIIESSKQKGRLGLGTKVEDTSKIETAGWDFDKETINLVEEVNWLPTPDITMPSYEELMSYIEYGKPLLTLDGCDNFIENDIVKDVNRGKSAFDTLDRKELLSGRLRSNPFELVKAGIFLNRAAMKMANMDHRLDSMFTNPRNACGDSLLTDPDSVLYFADICAGPGGFSEYILWRNSMQKMRFAHGFGFTLKGSNDFNLFNFFAGSKDFFEPCYGIRNDGDIYKSDNLVHFRDYVMSQTDNIGVCFTMADGGFSVESDRNNQEIISKRLYLCQCLCALMITREDGSFVTKLFDIFTNFSVGLIYLMRLAFRVVAIVKPITSRPANSERYLVCKHKRKEASVICDYLFEINALIENCKKDTDILDIVPLETLKSDYDFFNYIHKSNYDIALQQVIALNKLRIFTLNKNLNENRQYTIKKDCFKKWDVPMIKRSNPNVIGANSMSAKYISIKDLSMPAGNGEPVFQNLLKHRANYKCFPVANPTKVKLFLSTGKVYTWEEGNWRMLSREYTNDCNLGLPNDTIVLGELVEEMTFEKRKCRRQVVFYAYDGLVLNGRLIGHLDFATRRQTLASFLPTLRKYDQVVKFRLAEEISLTSDLLNNLKKVKVPWKSWQLDCFYNEDETFYKSDAVLILKITNFPWHVEYSKSRGMIYYYDSENKVSKYETNMSIYKNFINSYKSRHTLIWNSTKTSNFSIDQLNKLFQFS